MMHCILVSSHTSERIKSHKSIFVDRIKILLSIGYADLLIALKSGFIFIAIRSPVMCLLRFVSFLVSSIMWSDIWGALRIKFWQGIIQYNTPIYIIHCIGGIHKGMWERTLQMQNLSIRRHKILRWQPKVIFLMYESEHRDWPHGTLPQLNT